MVTAVESNMVGNLLRRLHLHPMDAAFNDLDSRRNTTISHLRTFLPSWSKSTTNVSSYNRTPPHDNLLFTTPCSRKEDNMQDNSQVVKKLGNSSSCPSSDIKSKPFRRTTRTKLRHAERYSQCVSSAPYPTAILVKLKRLSPSPDSARHVTIVDSAPKSLPPSFSVMVGSGRRSCGTSSCYTSPPVLHSPSLLPVSSFAEHLSPPTLSNSKNLSSGQSQRYSSSVPTSHPTSPLFTSCQPTIAPAISLDKIASVEPSEESPAISSMRQQAIKSTFSVVTETRKQDLSTMYHLRDRYANPRRRTTVSSHTQTVTVPSSSSAVSDQPPDTLAVNHSALISQKPLAHTKRRRSFDQLGEFSIHGTPELSYRLRERRPAEVLTISSQQELPSVSTVVTVTQSSPNVVPSLCLPLEYESDYYWPDFEALTSVPVDLHHGGVSVDGGTNVVEKNDGIEAESLITGQQSWVTRDQTVIEVPSWRYTALTEVADFIAKSSVGSQLKPPFSKQNLSMDHPPMKQEPGSQSSTSVLRTLRAGVLRSPGLLEITPSPVSLAEGHCLDLGGEETEEDISDAAYATRHSRSEWEEIKRERRSRQRSMEEELKQRWEQRDRATWQKRQPGRPDPLTKYNPDDRMPTQLNQPFSQIRRFCVDDKRLPAIVFGCRVPLSCLRSFKRRQ